MKNKFITFEGIDGVGKSTQINLFLKKIKENNFEYSLFREPGGTHLSERIRDILLNNDNQISDITETLLFLTARADLVNKKIKPKLEQGNSYVVCDRFLDSTLAYQSFGRGIDLNLVQSITNEVVGDVIPSTTFLLDCNIDISLKRLGKKDRMESSGKDFLLKVKEGFLELALLNKNRYVIIDANKSISQIENFIWNQFKNRHLK